MHTAPGCPGVTMEKEPEEQSSAPGQQHQAPGPHGGAGLPGVWAQDSGTARAWSWCTRRWGLHQIGPGIFLSTAWVTQHSDVGQQPK